ncbi:hypothetical protein NDU88_003680 [Pleurodeles waltl]|uniref:Uncharacterized protein n=1 Tax=Pleurodeles waltl TaxID=8319 RepID=A0AAV7SGN6_PLEWA|nr:hypothetical protein NDU88_003680 [Pleurodeles waltl]
MVLTWGGALCALSTLRRCPGVLPGGEGTRRVGPVGEGPEAATLPPPGGEGARGLLHWRGTGEAAMSGAPVSLPGELSAVRSGAGGGGSEPRLRLHPPAAAASLLRADEAAVPAGWGPNLHRRAQRLRARGELWARSLRTPYTGKSPDVS